MKVTRKFTIALITGIVLVHAVSVVVRVRRERALFYSDISRDALILGRALGYAIERGWSAGGEAHAMGLIQHATDQESHVNIRWVWLDSKAREPNSPAASPGHLKPLTRGQSVVVPLGEGEGTLYTYVPVRVPVHRAGALEIADPLADEQDYLKQSVLNATLSALVLVAVCGLLTVLLGFYLIGRPVKRLVEQARSVGRGDFATRLALPAKDELGELASEMDQMTDNLQTARQQLEQETEKRFAAIEQLRHADRLTSVGTLASGVAHELGTPITIIEGHSQLIREDTSSGDRAKENARLITRQCKRMTQIIQQLLDFARRGRQRDGETNACEAVRETLRMVDPLLRKQNIDASFEDSSEALVAINFARLQQVLMNLMINAIHAMPSGGRLVLSVDRRRKKNPESGHEAEHVIIAVEDTGAGMEPETVGRAFEPFYTTKEVGEGTGLGLSVAFGIVKDHDGWLEARSDPGQGSIFTVFLPAEPVA